MKLPDPKITPPARVVQTLAGTKLFVYGVEVRRWLGSVHDKDATDLAFDVNAAARQFGKA